MRGRRASSSGSGERNDSSQDKIDTIRTRPLHIYDNITRRLLQLGVTLGITTFIGLIVRYAVQEFDPTVSTITVTTARVNNRDVASLSVSKNFLERILEFICESLSIVAISIPIGFPLCTLFNRHFAKVRAGSKRFSIKSNDVLGMIPKYLIIGDSMACQTPDSSQHLRPLVRDTMYHLIKARLKPKLIVEDSYEEARKLGIRIGLIKRDHHKLAVIKSVDLLKNITDSRGDIKQGRVRYLLSRMKIMSQSTPADKSLLIYLIKHCESLPNENLAYLGYSFTDPEAMRLADCALTFDDCDDDDVKRSAQVVLKSANNASCSFTDVYLFMIVCMITSNITQSYALYQISASVSSCIYRFLAITVFQEQVMSHSQFVLLISVQQVFAILALMTKWVSSLPQARMNTPVAEMSHAATEDSMAADMTAIVGGGGGGGGSGGYRSRNSNSRRTTSVGNLAGLDASLHSLNRASSRERQSTATDNEMGALTVAHNNGGGGDHHHHQQHQQQAAGAGAIKMHRVDDTLGSSTSLDGNSSDNNNAGQHMNAINGHDNGNRQSYRSGRKSGQHQQQHDTPLASSSLSRHSMQSSIHARGRGLTAARQQQGGHLTPKDERPIHLSGADFDLAIINSKIATNYKQTFHNSSLIDDVTYRLAKLHIAYQILVMIIVMIFGEYK